ncbi:MAG: hypothetical protein ACLQOZ_15525 [Acidimicrobiales bacterium]
MAERDASTLLRTLTLSRRPGRFCSVGVDEVARGVASGHRQRG